MAAHLKQHLKRWGRRAGLEIRPSGILSRDDLRLRHFLELQAIDTVLDVGANDGGFAKSLIEVGFRGRIISFEPLPRAYDELVSAASRIRNWSAAPRMALSDENGIAKFNIRGGVNLGNNRNVVAWARARVP